MKVKIKHPALVQAILDGAPPDAKMALEAYMAMLVISLHRADVETRRLQARLAALEQDMSETAATPEQEQQAQAAAASAILKASFGGQP